MVWALGGLGAAFGLGWRSAARSTAALTGLLWGGAVRMLVLHHVTYSINSLCHFFGRRPYATERRVPQPRLAGAVPTFGEAWHNNHHAFPTSAFHGLRRREVDPSARGHPAARAAGLAWDVVRVPPERQASKLA